MIQRKWASDPRAYYHANIYSVGDPPYDRVTVFGRGDFNESNIKFEALGGKLVGTQSPDAPILLPIYATIA